jgi:hypothetical protein
MLRLWGHAQKRRAAPHKQPRRKPVARNEGRKSSFSDTTNCGRVITVDGKVGFFDDVTPASIIWMDYTWARAFFDNIAAGLFDGLVAWIDPANASNAGSTPDPVGCVMVRDGMLCVWDDSTGTIVRMTHGSADAFFMGVKAGEFNDMIESIKPEDATNAEAVPAPA